MTCLSKNSISRPLSRISGSIQVKLMFVLAAILLAASFSLRPSFAQDAIVLVGSGSSVPAPLYNCWAAEYNKRNPAIQFRYLPIGASGGRPRRIAERDDCDRSLLPPGGTSSRSSVHGRAAGGDFSW